MHEAEALAAAEIIQKIKESKTLDRMAVERIKNEAARKHRLNRILTNSEILAQAKGSDLELLLPLLRRKPVRTLSGIAVLAVMARPHPCPGECIYCPRGENAPQSYTGFEPAALRAKRANYDPYAQVSDRLAQLAAIGHPVDKSELIIMGGTFTAQPREYQEWFVKRCLQAMNEFSSSKSVASDLTLTKVQELSEKARVRNVGITFETRPDFAKREHVAAMLEMGVTRVELGVQTLSDEVYKKINRGHSVSDVAEATKALKDAGLKVGYHMMPGLFSDFAEDLRTFKELFSDERFKPDMIKIYPVLVVKGTKLYEMWKRGEFKPYSDEEALKLICEIKKILPSWVRTMRIQRDIPAQLIEAGVKKSDLGELVHQRLKEQGARCRCIRCRDVGHRVYRDGVKVNEKEIEIKSEAYQASEGDEHFLSAEHEASDSLVAYLRLRFPSSEDAFVRELRVLGQSVPIGAKSFEAEQHRGWGEALLKRAESLAAQRGSRRLLVTSAIGAREYYKRFGYSKTGCYMGKELR